MWEVQMYKDIVAKITGLNKAYKKVFSTEEGKKVLADILNRGYIHKSISSNDPNKTLAAAAKQELALEILHQVGLTDDELQNVIKNYTARITKMENTND